MIDKNVIYYLKEAAELTRYSKSTLRRRIKNGEIKIVSKPNENIRIWGSELIKLTGQEDE